MGGIFSQESGIQGCHAAIFEIYEDSIDYVEETETYIRSISKLRASYDHPTFIKNIDSHQKARLAEIPEYNMIKDSVKAVHHHIIHDKFAFGERTNFLIFYYIIHT